jgi:hypothetical protein
MTNEELKREFNSLNTSINDVKGEAGDKGHFFVLLILIFLLLYSADMSRDMNQIKEALKIPAQDRILH